MKIVKKISKRCIWIFDRQWDYKYLKDCLQYNDVDSLYIGSSYTIFGVNPGKRDINLALPSQDN